MRGFYQVSKDSIDRSENPKDGSENPNDQCENPNDLYEETPEVVDALPLPKIREKRQERSRGLCDTPLIGKQLQLAQCPRYLVRVFFFPFYYYYSSSFYSISYPGRVVSISNYPRKTLVEGNCARNLLLNYSAEHVGTILTTNLTVEYPKKRCSISRNASGIFCGCNRYPVIRTLLPVRQSNSKQLFMKIVQEN